MGFFYGFKTRKIRLYLEKHLDEKNSFRHFIFLFRRLGEKDQTNRKKI